MIKRFAALILTAVLSASALCGCSYGPSEDEARGIVASLIDASLELNEIYYGDGLPYEKSAGSALIESAAEAADADVDALIYHPVAHDCPYQSISAIKEATEKVFTPAYCKILYEVAFAGVSGESGEDGTTTIGAVYARYIEDYGVLTVNANIASTIADRTYDTDSMTFERISDRFMTVIVPSFVDGKPDVDVRLKLVNTDNGWRLDSPTY